LSETVLKIDALRFGYTKDNLLFNDFSLELKKGEIVSIVGPSGKGKSTLFDLIAGFLKPNSGSIEAKKLSFVFQDPYSSFHPSYTIREQIADVAEVIDEDFLGRTFNLEPSFLDKKSFELSGGQLQRLSIFRALMMKPDLLLADEPTSALDVLVQLEVMKNIVELSRDIGVLIITHDMDMAKWCSNRIVAI
jgi:peptide/nickel transport system ATP-binding protein